MLGLDHVVLRNDGSFPHGIEETKRRMVILPVLLLVLSLSLCPKFNYGCCVTFHILIYCLNYWEWSPSPIIIPVVLVRYTPFFPFQPVGGKLPFSWYHLCFCFCLIEVTVAYTTLYVSQRHRITLLQLRVTTAC